MKPRELTKAASALCLTFVLLAVSGCSSTTSSPASRDDTRTPASTTPSGAVRSSSSLPPPVQGAARFSATPLTDFKPGELYLNRYPGMLYTDSNEPPAEHDADGRAAAAKIVPIDGKIVVVTVGMSNWTFEMCSGNWPQCRPNSFIGQLNADSRVNHATLVVVDCAQIAQGTAAWLDDRRALYSQCRQRLADHGLTEKQVQAVLWLNGNPGPTSSLASTKSCSRSSSVDACVYTTQLGEIVRYTAKRYPNLRQFFVHSRNYGGYATSPLNPEPYAYEYGFATKWLVEAQVNQLRSGKVDALAGDLGYRVAPWIAWGPYLWASGDTPRQDGLTWDINDFVPMDRTHPSPLGVEKVATLMMKWYLSSPYTTWFRAAGN